MQKRNVPYVKQYDDKGLLSNPINGFYKNEHPNRRSRRSTLNSGRFRGNHKGISLSVVDNGKYSTKYERVVQLVALGNNKFKTINHYRERRSI